MRTAAPAALVLAALLSACGSSADSLDPADSIVMTVPPSSRPTTTSEAKTEPDVTAAEPAWTDEEITFAFESDQLFGVLTRPSGAGPHPAIVLLSGSGDAQGVRSGAETGIFIDHSRELAGEGFAVLRYDPPGVGRSTGGGVIPSLEERTEETHAAIRYLQSLPDIAGDRIGLQGWSQGPWIMAMTAVRYPGDVAFLVSIVGSGQSVAMQQVYGIGAQTEAAGFPPEDVAKAVLMGRLLIDWQLPEPMFEEANRTDADALGDGPWAQFAALLYEPVDISAMEQFTAVADILRIVRDEPWAEALYLDLYLSRLDAIPPDLPPEALAGFQAVMAENLLIDPKDFLTQVRAPLLAFFGEEDLNIDTETSSALFEQYLIEAGNEHFTIVVLPSVGHNIGLGTPGYWLTLAAWLDNLFPE